MALIKCPECGKEISDKAAACPNCGCPIHAETPMKKVGIGENFKRSMLFNADQKVESIQIDTKHRFWRKGITGDVLTFDDIIDVQIHENGSAVSKTKTGSIVGRTALGALISPAGALIGGVTAKKKHDDIVNKLEVVVLTRNLSTPTINIDTGLPKKTKKDSKKYEKYYDKAMKIQAALKAILTA